MASVKPALILRSETPLNGGPPPEALCREFLTPTDLFFVRNHGSVPEIDPAAYRLVVRGLVARSLRLSLEDLQTQFPRVRLEASLQCAGNRRRELMVIAQIPGEISWGIEAIGTAVWSGWRLGDVLEKAGVTAAAAHVAFTGLDRIVRAGAPIGFGGSIPLKKALSLEVLLADQMNGEPLSAVHGFPLRVIVPGYIGARSVKWLREIALQEQPSENYYQTHAYKMFPAGVRAESVDWTQGTTIGEFPLNAAICQPLEGALLRGPAHVRGYALTSGGRRIERVDLSGDGGRSWRPAELTTSDNPWTWALFEGRLVLPPGDHEICVRATDSGANVQPEDARTIWNFKGYLNNAWHRVRVRAA